MLRIPPAHFRPDASYGGGYDAQSGRALRHHIASALASAHGLVLESDWPIGFARGRLLSDDRGGRAAAAGAAGRAGTGFQDGLGASRCTNSIRWPIMTPLFALQPAASAWHLAEVHAVTTGRNVSVAQLDSGVEVSHPDLAGQISIAENFVDAHPYVAEMHGNRSGGDHRGAGGQRDRHRGRRTRARLMALRACWEVGTTADCNSFTLAKAFSSLWTAGPP